MQKVIFSLTLKRKFSKYMCKKHENNDKGSEDFEREDFKAYMRIFFENIGIKEVEILKRYLKNSYKSFAFPCKWVWDMK